MIFPSRICMAILLCTLLLGCSEKKDRSLSPFVIPADSVISPDKMVLIMADVHVIEAALLFESNEALESKEDVGFYYKGIFNKYHISPARYNQNLKFYRQNPENFARMYEQVIKVTDDRQKKFTGVAR